MCFQTMFINNVMIDIVWNYLKNVTGNAHKAPTI